MVNALKVIQDLALFDGVVNNQLVHFVLRVDPILLADGEYLDPDRPKLLLNVIDASWAPQVSEQDLRFIDRLPPVCLIVPAVRRDV
jgi:hypothetical protein